MTGRGGGNGGEDDGFEKGVSLESPLPLVTSHNLD